jgi:hypothetical protein
MSVHVNVRRLHVEVRPWFKSLFETVLNGKHLQHIKDIIWAYYTAVQIFENYAVNTSCDSGGKYQLVQFMYEQNLTENK